MVANTDVELIEQLFSPPEDTAQYNPADYFNKLVFSHPEVKYSNADAKLLVEFMFNCDFMAIRAMSGAMVRAG